MKILVIDDSHLHQASAQQTLQGHDFVIAKTHDEARTLLDGDRDRSIAPQSFDVVLSDLLMPAGKKTQGPKGERYVGQEMPVGFALALLAVVRGAKYVAVVTDTGHHDHPASAMLDPFASECPHKYDSEGKPPRFVMNGARVGFYHSPCTFVEGSTCPDCGGSGRKDICHCTDRNGGTPKTGCESCGGVGHYCWTCRNTGKARGKDWGKVLAHLTAE
jgi:CheY-like chemotaxis protein